ncbi:MAG TPA: hypothetical protein DEB24_03990 [Coriobacteriia bacterium]|nr:hypothetical protein [Coriobacteriia bacterium]
MTSYFSDVIRSLRDIGFKINWTLLKIGYEGRDFLPRLISADEIRRYAEDSIDTMETGYESIARFIISEGEASVCEVLGEMSRRENADRSIQARKLRAYLVRETLATLTSDYFKGLLELSDLWATLGFPDDGPHIIQGSHNSLSPQEYYTQDMFELLLERHERWLEGEVRSIKGIESNVEEVFPESGSTVCQKNDGLGGKSDA